MTATNKSAAATACAPSKASSVGTVKPSEDNRHFYISAFPPNSNWPNGGWSLYRITGEEIAQRTIWERKDGKLEVSERWPWPGYIGYFPTLESLMEAVNG